MLTDSGKGFDPRTNRTDLKELIEIGIALSSEKNIKALLNKIASAARRISCAEGVTVYICSENKKQLQFAVVQNDQLDSRLTRGEARQFWSHIDLYHDDGSKNFNNGSAYCALSGKPINIEDVYNEKGFDFSGTKTFDLRTHYRSRSMLLIPMCDHEDEVIGVLQLLNCRPAGSDEVIGFPESVIEIVSGLASQAAIAITNVRLVNQTEQLMKSFVKAIAYAIDEKSPYTAGHIERVVHLTENICLAISRSKREQFREILFSQDQMEEIRLAAWLHDIGKIATPQFIADKATKLETVVDRIELVRLRLEILKRDIELKQLGGEKIELSADQLSVLHPLPAEIPEEMLESIDDFLHEINRGRECLQDDAISRIKKIAEWPVNLHDGVVPLLSEDELECCTIKKGTLTDAERAIINRHVVITIEMLTKLPFPKKWQHVPEYAGCHHEKLDGSGYPRGLTSGSIPLPARIIAVADIFEALTASDRPYKKGMKLSRAVTILGFMVKDGHLDGDICDILLEDGVALDYARIQLPDLQRDGYEWNSKNYSPDV